MAAWTIHWAGLQCGYNKILVMFKVIFCKNPYSQPEEDSPESWPDAGGCRLVATGGLPETNFFAAVVWEDE